MRFKRYLKDAITVDIEVGDTVLGGKFKNKRIVVKDIGTNDKGDITINGKPLLKVRLLPKGELQEAAYAGNIGFEEMVRFYQVANKSQEAEMEKAIRANNWKKFKELIKKVLGVSLK